jgi:hypothetical protein
MPKGGYRKPSKPAAFSGAGAYSSRTDGGPMDKQPIRPMPADGQYGARVASKRMQQAAPMAATPQPSTPKIVGMFEPNSDAAHPVTTGNVLGAGAGPEAMMLPNSRPSLTSTLRRLAQVDQSGDIEYVLQQLNERGIV